MAAKVFLSTKNVVNRSLNLLYPLECEHEHWQMPKEIPKIEQTDWRSRKTEKTKNSQSYRAMNVNPTIKAIQKLTFKDPQERLQVKLKTEYSDKI